MTGRLLLVWRAFHRPRHVRLTVVLRLGLRRVHDDPAFVPGDRPGFLDENHVADLARVALVVRLVLLAHPHGLLHHRMREPALDADDDRLVVLVAHDGALQNALWHLFAP